jgi:hypothetical protein
MYHAELSPRYHMTVLVVHKVPMHEDEVMENLILMTNRSTLKKGEKRITDIPTPTS